MKYILHIDTATDAGIVAIAADGNIVASRTNNESRNHAGTINIMIDEILLEAKISLNDLDCIAVCGGPGSYTGLRIGMATAKGLCDALDKPLVVDNRLTLLAYKTWLNKSVAINSYISLLKAREKEYFISIFDSDFHQLVPAQHINEGQLPEMIAGRGNISMTTDIGQEVINSLNINHVHVHDGVATDLSSWAKYSLEQLACSNTQNLASAEPFYLKQVYTHK